MSRISSLLPPRAVQLLNSSRQLTDAWASQN
jgi:hypothetical protein